MFLKLPNNHSFECVQRLRQVGLVEPPRFDAYGIEAELKSSHTFFHPQRHIPPTNASLDMNISPVEGYTFSATLSMQNVQYLIQCAGLNKYVCKYVGKIDEQNYVVVFANNKKNGRLMTQSTFLHNTKIASSKHNEQKAKESKGEDKHPQGRAISLMEMVHIMLEYKEVHTDMLFKNIPSVALELRPGVERYKE